MIGLGEPLLLNGSLLLNGPQSEAAPRKVVEPVMVWWSVEVVAVALRRHWSVLAE